MVAVEEGIERGDLRCFEAFGCWRIPSATDIGVAQYRNGDALFGSPSAEPKESGAPLAAFNRKVNSRQSEVVLSLLSITAGVLPSRVLHRPDRQP